MHKTGFQQNQFSEIWNKEYFNAIYLFVTPLTQGVDISTYGIALISRECNNKATSHKRQTYQIALS